jgi:hypothetical protein
MTDTEKLSKAVDRAELELRWHVKGQAKDGSTALCAISASDLKLFIRIAKETVNADGS